MSANWVGLSTTNEGVGVFVGVFMEPQTFWEMMQGAIALDPQAFDAIQTAPNGDRIALQVLLLAGFSQAIGQGIVLFVNQVKPLRFFLSLILSAILFAISYAVWVWSTWLISQIFLGQVVEFQIVYRTIGLAAAPQILSFLIAMPYFGVPIQVMLSMWALFALVQGFNAATGFGIWSAFGCSILGWLLLQIFQRTIGRPIAKLGSWLSNTTAGTSLVTNLRDLETVLEQGLQTTSSSEDQS